MKYFYTVLFLSIFSISYGQFVDFEEFELESESVFNGAEEDGGIQSENIFLHNSLNPAYSSWSGFAISNKTDITTAGFTNGYSAITGSGVDGSSNYAVSFTLGSSILNVTEGGVNSFFVTNSTYTALSMLNGDQFAKKFGGEDGNDPDFFLLTLKGWDNGNMMVDSVDVYLADYRFEDNSLDYVLSEWKSVELGQLSDADSLQFTLTSTDNSSFGMNTPSYFCIDQFKQNIANSVMNEAITFAIYPNPVSQTLTIETNEKLGVEIYNASGVLMSNSQINQTTALNIEKYTTGVYYVRVSDGISSTTKRFIKI